MRMPDDPQRDVLIGVMASLAATISILERAFEEKKPPNKVVGSDTMFRQMLIDYNRALETARVSLRSPEPK